MPRERLDPEAVEKAEQARSLGNVVVAAEIAAAALGFPDAPLSDKEIFEISRDPEQRAVLACLARIHVAASESIANRQIFPHKALPPLESAAETVGRIYNEPYFRRSISSASKDHLGREHYFDAEMQRDDAALRKAAALFFGGDKARTLEISGETILQHTYDYLPEDHPTKPLIGIEIQLSKASRGEAVDTRSIAKHFETLKDSQEKFNPHRVATVASWLVVWGEKLKNEEMEQLGAETFNRITREHPEWAFMTEDQRKKMTVNQLKRFIFKVLAPLTTVQGRRDALYRKILNR